jgi:hypothetical protein
MADFLVVTVPTLKHDGGIVHMGNVQAAINDLSHQIVPAINQLATGGLPPGGTAGGGLSGTYPNPVVSNASAGFAVTGTLTATGNATVQGTLSSTSNIQPATPTNTGVAIGGGPNYSTVLFYDQTQTVNNRTSRAIFISGATRFAFLNDLNSLVTDWLVASGGYASGITGITSNSGSGAWVHTGTLNATTVQSGGVTLNPTLAGTSASIGGSALTAGQTTTTTVTVTGATTAMVALCSPVTYPGAAFTWDAYVSAPNTVTVVLQATIAGTPTASTYNVRVIQ